MMKLGFKHQHCIYHLRLAINEQIKKYLKQKDIEFRIQFQKENKKISQHKLNKLVKKEINTLKDEINIYKQLFFELFEQQTYNKAINYIKLLKDEINIYKQLFFELFEQQTYNKAINYIKLLKNEIKNFPEVLKNYLLKKFFPEYKNFLWFLKKEFKGKLSRTDNSSEMYFHGTLPKAEKKRYRTINGIFNQIYNRKWMDEKNKIPTNKMTDPLNKV